MEFRENGFHKVLVLNTSFIPINICGWRRAMALLFKEKATALEDSRRLVNSRYVLPFVIKLRKYVPLPYKSVELTRKNIYLRDNFTCQYCGKTGGNLTIDHVIPRSKGGEDNWGNMVVCCQRCNNRKGDQALDDSGLKLVGMPYRPPSSLYLHMTRLSNIPKSWYNYFFKGSVV